MIISAAPPRMIGALVISRIPSIMEMSSVMKKRDCPMTILSIFRTDIPMISYPVPEISAWTACTGSAENMRSRSLTAFPALSAASAIIHAPEGRTGTG
jgi:hypothetical protein